MPTPPPATGDTGQTITLAFTPDGVMPSVEDVGAAAAWCLRRGRYPIGAALAVLAEAIENSDARMVLTMMDEQAEHPRMARGGDLDPAIPHPYRRPIGGAAQVPAVCWCGEDEHAAVHDLGIN